MDFLDVFHPGAVLISLRVLVSVYLFSKILSDQNSTLGNIGTQNGQKCKKIGKIPHSQELFFQKIDGIHVFLNSVSW